MLKNLEQEGAIETAAISAHPTYVLVLRVERIEAVFEFVGLVLLLKDA